MTETIEPKWVSEEVILAMHDRQIAEFGGLQGVRDMSLLQSVIARPQNIFCYEQVTSLTRLAAAYAYGVARNHPFVDGNKRTAWVLARLFLALNNVRIGFAPEEAIHMVLALASGVLAEAEVADWFRARNA